MAKAHEQRRQRAIDRYLAGDPIEDICREWACSKSWLYTWRDRYLATDLSWSAARSRRPRTTPTKTPQRIAQAVVALRQTLAQQGQRLGGRCHPAGARTARDRAGAFPANDLSDSPPLCKGDAINRPPSSIRPSARKCSPSLDMAPSSREYGNVRRCVIDRTARLLLTREAVLSKANSLDISRENT